MIGVLGGTFDPIHFGHLRPALELVEQLGLDEVRLIPARVPPHRGQPAAGVDHRLAMLERAISGESRLHIDTRELSREGPSYTVDTLKSLRSELGADMPLGLIMGMDAFYGLATWHRWRELTEHANLVVTYRPDSPVPRDGELGHWLRSARVQEPGALKARAAGELLVWSVTQLDISATGIRELVGAGRSARYLLPDSVWTYIREHGLYGAR